MIVCGTSALLAPVNRGDRDFTRVREAMERAGEPYMVPAATLGEGAYFIEARMTLYVLDEFLADLESSRYGLDAGESDFSRIRHLARRYADLRPGMVDACAERRGAPVLTLDRRRLTVVA